MFLNEIYKYKMYMNITKLIKSLKHSQDPQSQKPQRIIRNGIWFVSATTNWVLYRDIFNVVWYIRQRNIQEASKCSWPFTKDNWVHKSGDCGLGLIKLVGHWDLDSIFAVQYNLSCEDQKVSKEYNSFSNFCNSFNETFTILFPRINSNYICPILRVLSLLLYNITINYFSIL